MVLARSALVQYAPFSLQRLIRWRTMWVVW
eukprot:COSAG02_NODE_47582_length_340_cov_0.688797_1_plen_29_part_10